MTACSIRRAFSLVIISALSTRELHPSAVGSQLRAISIAAYGEQCALRNRAGSLCNRCVVSAISTVRACMGDLVRAPGAWPTQR